MIDCCLTEIKRKRRDAWAINQRDAEKKNNIGQTVMVYHELSFYDLLSLRIQNSCDGRKALAANRFRTDWTVCAANYNYYY